MNNINEKILTQIGLTIEEATIYNFLLQNGVATAKVISVKTGIGRALTYKILDQLVAKELVRKREDLGKVALFSPAHPEQLKKTAEARKAQAEETIRSLAESYGSLASSYNLLNGKPNVQFFEGINGLRRVYDDILDVGQNILVVSAPIDEGRKEVLHLIREQIEKQAAQNIRTRTINPTGNHEPATQIFEDEKYLITRKRVPTEKLPLPAQIIIYGDKVAITNFKEGLITVAIESKYIRETFEKMFEYIWNQS